MAMSVNDCKSTLETGERLQRNSMIPNSEQGRITFFQGIGNAFTGNEDFKRDMMLQDRANSFTSMENQKARDFEERLSNTAYQRAVEDMRKAGLNPYLLYSSGRSMQSTTPSSSSASGQIPTRSRSGRAFEALLSLLPTLLTVSSMNKNAILQAQTSKEVAKIRAQNALEVQAMKRGYM